MERPDIDTMAQELWDYLRLAQTPRQADAIIACGSMDLRVAEKAAELWRLGFAPAIVPTGGYGRLTGVGWEEPEAKKFAGTLRAKNIPESAILLEDQATNSEENLVFSYNLLKKKGYTPKKLLIITLPFSERRMYATAQKAIADVEPMVSSPNLTYNEFPNSFTSREDLINLLVGEVLRIASYPAKGYITRQPMPSHIFNVAHVLVSLGYDKQIPQP